MTLHTTIHKCRKAAQISQKELAGRLGITPTYMSLIEKGSKPVGIKLLAEIAKALGTSPFALIFLSLEPSDIKEGKYEVYEALKPVIKELFIEPIAPPIEQTSSPGEQG